MSLPNVYIVFQNGEAVKSKGGKLYHHAKQHASSSIKQLAKEKVYCQVSSSRYQNQYEYSDASKKVEKKFQSEFEIKEFRLIEISQ